MRLGGKGASLEEIEAVYRQRLPQFRRAAAAIVGDRESALDVVQEAFASAVRKRETFRGEGPLEAWLWRTVVNAARTHRRSSLSSGFEIELAERWNGSTDDAVERVRLAVSLLPEQQRHALFLHYYSDLGYGTIAETLGISPGTVGATLTAARESLRRLLEEVPR